jgi:hypothetical protein
LALWAEQAGEMIMQCQIFQNQSDKMLGKSIRSDKMLGKSIRSDKMLGISIRSDKMQGETQQIG